MTAAVCGDNAAVLPPWGGLRRPGHAAPGHEEGLIFSFIRADLPALSRR